MGNRAVDTKPKISGAEAAKNLGLTLDPQNNLYYDTKGQYYSAPTYEAPVQSYSGVAGNGYMGVGGWQSLPQYGNGSFFGANNTKSSVPEGALVNNYYTFNPFTGSAKGVSAGQRSVVDRLINRQQQYTPAPTLADLFPTLTSPVSTQTPTGEYGASRFTSGLLGPSLTFTGTNT